jgi:SAM-dependent methyltransferase
MTDDRWDYVDSLIGALRGTVLEIGAGRGRNLPKYHARVRWIGLEPDASRRARLERAAAAHGRHEPVLASGAEQIPLPDNSVDAVVATVVLCSVRDAGAILAEVRRVLRPGGVFVFVEHVSAARRTRMWLWQRIAAPVQRLMLHGCDPSRESWRDIEAAGFARLEMRWYTSRLWWDTDGRYIAGRATA